MTTPTLVRVSIDQGDEHQGQTPADQPTSHVPLLSSHLLKQLFSHGLGIGLILPSCCRVLARDFAVPSAMPSAAAICSQVSPACQRRMNSGSQALMPWSSHAVRYRLRSGLFS